MEIGAGKHSAGVSHLFLWELEAAWKSVRGASFQKADLKILPPKSDSAFEKSSPSLALEAL